MLHELANEDGDLGQSLRGLSESRCQVSLKSSSAIRAFGAAPLRVGFVCEGVLAEREGFEPTVVLPTHAFQACALNHSAISPPKDAKNAPTAGSEATVLSLVTTVEFTPPFGGFARLNATPSPATQPAGERKRIKRSNPSGRPSSGRWHSRAPIQNSFIRSSWVPPWLATR
jgi:hypothetical protein